MNREPTAPMTFGQLSVLRSLEYNSYQGDAAWTEANSASLWELPDGAAVDTVRSAWLQLTLANQALRTVYDWQGAEPIQIVRPVRMSTLDVFELDDDRVESAENLAVGLIGETIPIDVAPPWRAVIATYRHRPRFLAMAWHHIAVDDTALAVLKGQFDGVLAGRAPGRQPQPIELARAERSGGQEAIEYWTTRWAGFAGEDRAGNDHSRRIQACMYTPAGMAAAEKISRRLGVSLQAVVLGVAYIVLARLTGRERVTFALVAANRFDQRWASLVSSMVQLAPLTAVVTGSGKPDEFLRDIHARSLEAYLHGSYHVDELRERLVAMGVANPEPMEFDCYFNFVGESGTAPSPDSPMATSIEWQRTFRQTGARFNLVVATGAGLRLVLRASRNYLDEERMAAFLTAFEAAAVSIAGQRPGSIDQIAMEPMRPVPAR